MEFQPSKLQAFLDLFTQSSPLIRAFPGVGKLELHRDADLENVYFTLSEWDSDSSLENYRKSELFNKVWTQTKQYFAASPQAFSLVHKMSL